jgi:hypothetical protein
MRRTFTVHKDGIKKFLPKNDEALTESGIESLDIFQTCDEKTITSKAPRAKQSEFGLKGYFNSRLAYLNIIEYANLLASIFVLIMNEGVKKFPTLLETSYEFIHSIMDGGEITIEVKFLKEELQESKKCIYHFSYETTKLINPDDQLKILLAKGLIKIRADIK